MARRERIGIAAAALLSAAGCFDPEIPSGAVRCGPGGACPGGLVCDPTEGVCLEELPDRADAAARGDGPVAADAGGDNVPPDADPGADGGAPLCDPSDPDLVACYGFEGEVTDGSSYENHGSASGVLFPAAYDGLGIEQVEGPEVLVPESTSLGELTSLTVELWLRPNALPSARESVLMDKDGQYALDITPNGVLRGRITTDGGDGNMDHLLTASTELQVSAWTHAALTFDGGQARLYMNGDAVAAMAVSDPLAPSPGAGMTITHENPSGAPFVGQIDRMRVWSFARSQQEICAEAGTDSC